MKPEDVLTRKQTTYAQIVELLDLLTKNSFLLRPTTTLAEKRTLKRLLFLITDLQKD